MIVLFTLIACGLQREPVDVAPVLALTGDATKGEAQFQMTCAACHGQLGHGVSRTPALAGNVHTFTDEELVHIMLNGRGAMTPQRLTPQHAANIVAYVRASWPE